MKLQSLGRLSWVPGWAVLAIACWAGAQLSRLVEHSPGYAGALWIPAGISLGAVLLKGYRVWPGIAIGLLVAELPIYESWVIALGIAVGGVLQAVCGAWLIRRAVADRDPMGRTRDTAYFLLSGVLLATMVGAAVAVAALCFTGRVSWAMSPTVWRQWWLGDAMGALVAGPVLLAWWRQVSIPWKPLFWIETFGLVLVMGFVSWFAFGRVVPLGGTPYPLTAFTIPVFVWSALRFGRRGTTVAIAVFAVCAIWGTAHGFGSLIRDSFENSILAAQSNLGLISAAVLLSLAAVSEWREAINEVSATETRYRVLFEQSPDAVMLIDTQTNRPLQFNKKAPKLLGYTSEEFRNLQLDDFELPDSRQIAESSMGSPFPRGSAGGHLSGYETTYRRKDGQGITVLVRFSCISLLQRRAFLMTVRDITAQRRAEVEVRQLNADLDHASRLSIMGEMAAGVAHELQQPLTVIANYANGCVRRLRGGDSDPESLATTIGDVVQEAMRASEIVRRIRDFVRKREMRRQWSSIASIVHDAVQLASFNCSQQGVRVLLRCDEPSPAVFVDRIQMTHVVLNILMNGIDAMAETMVDERVLEVAVDAIQDSWVEVAITDRGVGVAEDVVEHIFDQFFTTKRNGLGMGLAISRSVVQAHDGQLTVTTRLNRGSTFRLTLPAGGPGLSETWPDSGESNGKS